MIFTLGQGTVVDTPVREGEYALQFAVSPCNNYFAALTKKSILIYWNDQHRYCCGAYFRNTKDEYGDHYDIVWGPASDSLFVSTSEGRHVCVYTVLVEGADNDASSSSLRTRDKDTSISEEDLSLIENQHNLEISYMHLNITFHTVLNLPAPCKSLTSMNDRLILACANQPVIVFLKLSDLKHMSHVFYLNQLLFAEKVTNTYQTNKVVDGPLLVYSTLRATSMEHHLHRNKKLTSQQKQRIRAEVTSSIEKAYFPPNPDEENVEGFQKRVLLNCLGGGIIVSEHCRELEIYICVFSSGACLLLASHGDGHIEANNVKVRSGRRRSHLSKDGFVPKNICDESNSTPSVRRLIRSGNCEHSGLMGMVIRQTGCTTVSISGPQKRIALGYENGNIEIFRVSPLSWQEASKTYITFDPSENYLPSTGSVNRCQWSRDGVALLVCWANAGPALLSPSGQLLFVFSCKVQPITAASWIAFDLGIAVAGQHRGFVEYSVYRSSTIGVGCLYVDGAGARFASDSNSRLLIGPDRLLLCQGTPWSPYNMNWSHLPLPPSAYMSDNWPLRQASLCGTGEWLITTGYCGVALLNTLHLRWRLFGNIHHEHALRTGNLPLGWLTDNVFFVAYRKNEEGNEKASGTVRKMHYRLDDQAADELVTARLKRTEKEAVRYFLSGSGYGIYLLDCLERLDLDNAICHIPTLRSRPIRSTVYNSNLGVRPPMERRQQNIKTWTRKNRKKKLLPPSTLLGILDATLNFTAYRFCQGSSSIYSEILWVVNFTHFLSIPREIKWTVNEKHLLVLHQNGDLYGYTLDSGNIMDKTYLASSILNVWCDESVQLPQFCNLPNTSNWVGSASSFTTTSEDYNKPHMMKAPNRFNPLASDSSNDGDDILSCTDDNMIPSQEAKNVTVSPQPFPATRSYGEEFNNNKNDQKESGFHIWCNTGAELILITGSVVLPESFCTSPFLAPKDVNQQARMSNFLTGIFRSKSSSPKKLNPDDFKTEQLNFSYRSSRMLLYGVRQSSPICVLPKAGVVVMCCSIALNESKDLINVPPAMQLRLSCQSCLHSLIHQHLSEAGMESVADDIDLNFSDLKRVSDSTTSSADWALTSYANAVGLCQQLEPSPFFEQILELTFHSILDPAINVYLSVLKQQSSSCERRAREEAGKLSRLNSKCSSETFKMCLDNSQFRTLYYWLKLLRCYKHSLPNVLISTIRKTEPMVSPGIVFALGGFDPYDIFQDCVRTGLLRTASLFLVVLQNIFGPVKVRSQIVITLIYSALKQNDIPLCQNLITFFLALFVKSGRRPVDFSKMIEGPRSRRSSYDDRSSTEATLWRPCCLSAGGVKEAPNVIDQNEFSQTEASEAYFRLEAVISESVLECIVSLQWIRLFQLVDRLELDLMFWLHPFRTHLGLLLHGSPYISKNTKSSSASPSYTMFELYESIQYQFPSTVAKEEPTTTHHTSVITLERAIEWLAELTTKPRSSPTRTEQFGSRRVGSTAWKTGRSHSLSPCKENNRRTSIIKVYVPKQDCSFETRVLAFYAEVFIVLKIMGPALCFALAANLFSVAHEILLGDLVVRKQIESVIRLPSHSTLKNKLFEFIQNSEEKPN